MVVSRRSPVECPRGGSYESMEQQTALASPPPGGSPAARRGAAAIATDPLEISVSQIPAAGMLPQKRADVLSELVRLFASGKDPINLAQSAVEVVARVTGARGVFVYLWDDRIDRLVLRAVSDTDLEIPLSGVCLLYTSPSPRDTERARMPSSA